MTKLLFSTKINKKWLISATLISILAIFGFVYSFNQFYRQDRISLEVLQGSVIKTSDSQKNTIPARGNGIFPGDSIEISADGAVAMIFHDGSTLAFKAGEIIKYQNHDLKDQKNYFNFVKPSSNNENFEYVTETYLNKAGAVILGRQDGNMDNGNLNSQVLGASEKKITEVDKIKLWDSLNKCIQNGKNDLVYSKLVEKCMSENNLHTIESLNY